MPALRQAVGENLCAKGAYVLAETPARRDVTCWRPAPRLALAMEARGQLAKEGVEAAVVSMPCWELFAQPARCLSRRRCWAPRRASPSRRPSSWAGSGGSAQDGVFIGMEDFGASAPAPKLYEHFGITANKVAESARQAPRLI